MMNPLTDSQSRRKAWNCGRSSTVEVELKLGLAIAHRKLQLLGMQTLGLLKALKNTLLTEPMTGRA